MPVQARTAAAYLIPLRNLADTRGCLIPIEFADLPFVPRRVFFIQDVPMNGVRGGHAHARNKQVFVCLAGRISVRLVFEETVETVVLDSPRQGLFVDAGVWSEQRFLDSGTRLCVLASEPYDAASYLDAPALTRCDRNPT